MSHASHLHHRAKHLLCITAAALCLAAIPSCGKDHSQQATQSTQPTQPSLPTTARIVTETARTSRLYTSEYEIHKVVTHSDSPTVEGEVLGVPIKVKARLGDRKVAIPITVTLKAYIDFGGFTERNVARTPGGGIVITLPDPQVTATASRVDHAGTRQYIDLTRSRYTDAEMADFARQGADSIASHIGQLDIVRQAQRSATATLVPMLRRMGFEEKDIVIRFRKDFTTGELLQSIHPA